MYQYPQQPQQITIKTKTVVKATLAVMLTVTVTNELAKLALPYMLKLNAKIQEEAKEDASK